jgi:RNA polymerase sigma factor (sigma-70 family)
MGIEEEMTPLLAQQSRLDRNFERLYRRHAGDVYRYALAVLRNPADAEDVTQTTFLNAYRAFAHGDRPQTPKNWLIAIAHNVCRQRFRQAARRPNEVELNEDIAEALVSENPVGAEDIQRALAHLAFNQRAALVMRELEGRSYAEIAEILDVSVAAVETLIFRARRAVREQLEGTLTCSQAELAISKQTDGELSRAEKGQLRAHLRECKSCSTLARRLRAQRSAWKALGAIPLPGSLTGLFAGSGTSAAGLGMAGGGAVALKAASVVAAVAVAGGTAYQGEKLISDKQSAHAAAAAVSPDRVAPGASTQSARPYAPGQTKPAGERATKPAVPPGLAKNGVVEAHVAQAHREWAKTAHPTASAGAPGRVDKAEPPGQVRRTLRPAVATTATTRKKNRPHVRAHTKKPAQVAPKPASAASPETPAKPEAPEAGKPETPQSPDGNGAGGGGNGAGKAAK